ncbi:hypothetical protein ACFU9X_36690 [Streptomyces atratus]|uniref:hypothetical protein n=1 Tax=Streptomyces atratus TaxID=1893 RepID=UPI0036CFB1E1
MTTRRRSQWRAEAGAWALAQPGANLTVEAPVPIRSGDRVTLLGHDRPLRRRATDGSLVIDAPAAARRTGKHARVFKIARSG